RNCQDTHVQCQENSLRLDRPFGLMAVDTMSLCVHQISSEDAYLALSYVWGDRNTFLLSRDNLSTLSEAGALTACWQMIPQTIKDAIILAKDIGFRYLWVDALCIVQNDPNNKLRNIQQMASIYANATACIAA
ncbi:hypothetical protein BS50DRAFT_456493, partial [Corynespora cassiicola Philippines]